MVAARVPLGPMQGPVPAHSAQVAWMVAMWVATGPARVALNCVETAGPAHGPVPAHSAIVPWVAWVATMVAWMVACVATTVACVAWLPREAWLPASVACVATT